jgi:hypothetical protein
MVALGDDEPVVRGAAAWAVGRWISAGVMASAAREALVARAALETDVTVRAEIASALAAADIPAR